MMNRWILYEIFQTESMKKAAKAPVFPLAPTLEAWAFALRQGRLRGGLE